MTINSLPPSGRRSLPPRARTRREIWIETHNAFVHRRALPPDWEQSGLRGPLDPFLDRLFDDWLPRVRARVISPFVVTTLFAYVGWIFFDVGVPGAFSAWMLSWKLAASALLSVGLCAFEAWFHGRHGRFTDPLFGRWGPAVFTGIYAATVITLTCWHH